MKPTVEILLNECQYFVWLAQAYRLPLPPQGATALVAFRSTFEVYSLWDDAKSVIWTRKALKRVPAELYRLLEGIATATAPEGRLGACSVMADRDTAAHLVALGMATLPPN